MQRNDSEYIVQNCFSDFFVQIRKGKEIDLWNGSKWAQFSTGSLSWCALSFKQTETGMQWPSQVMASNFSRW